MASKLIPHLAFDCVPVLKTVSRAVSQPRGRFLHLHRAAQMPEVPELHTGHLIMPWQVTCRKGVSMLLFVLFLWPLGAALVCCPCTWQLLDPKGEHSVCCVCAADTDV